MDAAVVDLIRGVHEAFDRTALFRRVVGEPAKFQTELLTSTSNFILLNAARQSGKSSAMACLIAHVCAFEPGSLVAVTAPAMRQTLEILRKTILFKDALNLQATRATQLELEFVGGSRIVGLPSTSDTVRGLSNLRLLVADEFAFFQDGNGGHTILQALLPALGTKGVFVGASTPNGRHGNAFAEYWHDGDAIHRIRAPAMEIPHLREKAERAKSWMPASRWGVEYELRFEGSGSPFFAMDKIMEAFVDVPALRL
jgi:hypothetical protein